MPVVVEVSDDGHIATPVGEARYDLRERGSRLLVVYGDANQLRTCPRQRQHLVRRGTNVRRIRVGHGLNDDRVPASHGYVSDHRRNSSSTVAKAHDRW